MLFLSYYYWSRSHGLTTRKPRPNPGSFSVDIPGQARIPVVIDVQKSLAIVLERLGVRTTTVPKRCPPSQIVPADVSMITAARSCRVSLPTPKDALTIIVPRPARSWWEKTASHGTHADNRKIARNVAAANEPDRSWTTARSGVFSRMVRSNHAWAETASWTGSGLGAGSFDLISFLPPNPVRT